MTMVKFKVNSSEDDQLFVATKAYNKLYNTLKSLKTSKGRIIHVIGAPGTGKSSNIYEAIDRCELNVYDANLLIDNEKKSSAEVFNEFLNTIKRDMEVNSNKEMYAKASEYDTVLFADRFHDSHFFDENKIGLSIWANYNGVKTFPFYLMVISEYLKNRNELKQVNIIFQTAWTIRFRGSKYDLFTDFGPLTKLFVGLLKLMFEVVEVSYSETEITEIIKEHMPDADEKQIKFCIGRYGSKIRFILEDLEKLNVD